MAKEKVAIDQNEAASQSDKKKKTELPMRTLMNSDAFYSDVAERSGQSKNATQSVIRAIPDTIINAVLENKPTEKEGCFVPLPGLGIFGFRYKPASTVVNRLKEHEMKEAGTLDKNNPPMMEIGEHISISFRIKNELKTKINPETVDQIKKEVDKDRRETASKSATKKKGA